MKKVLVTGAGYGFSTESSFPFAKKGFDVVIHLEQESMLEWDSTMHDSQHVSSL
jgi:NADP-dependent 3-hydroxy acid dehydrogenase YdfG